MPELVLVVNLPYDWLKTASGTYGCRMGSYSKLWYWQADNMVQQAYDMKPGTPAKTFILDKLLKIF